MESVKCCEQGEVTFDIEPGDSRRGKETPCEWQLILGVPSLHPTLCPTACRLALTASTKKYCASTCLACACVCIYRLHLGIQLL